VGQGVHGAARQPAVLLQGPAAQGSLALLCARRLDHLARVQEENVLFHAEAPLSLQGCSVEPASEYTKRRHVISLRTPSGAEYLLQARDEVRLRFGAGPVLKSCCCWLSGGPGALAGAADLRHRRRARGRGALGVHARHRGAPAAAEEALWILHPQKEITRHDAAWRSTNSTVLSAVPTYPFSPCHLLFLRAPCLCVHDDLSFLFYDEASGVCFV